MKKKLLVMGITGLSFLVSTKVFSQAPVADFTISQPTTCVNSTVQITDVSTNTPTAWSYTVDSMTGTLTVQNPTLSFGASGNYAVTLVASNASGTSTPMTKTITVNGLPVLNVTQSSSVICAGDNATLVASGAATYTWSNGTANNGVFSPTATADYTVMATDANNCMNSAIQTITVNAVPVLTVSGTNSVCAGTAVTETVTGADTYSWSTGIAIDNITETPTSDATYSVTGTYTLTGCSAMAAKMVSVEAVPVLTVTSGSVCAGDVFTITATGADSYTYSNGSNTVIPTANDSYTVTGYSLNGCSDATLSIGVANVTVNALPVITVNGGTICAGSDFTLTPSGAATYSYTGGQAVVSPTTTESYSVTGTDANGCTSAAPAVAEVTVNAVPSLTVAGTNSICVGAAAVTETVSGADTYSWSTGAVIDNISDTPTLATTYSVTGTYTLTGCSAMAAKMVSVEAAPVLTVASGSVCAGDVFTITATGADSYTYSNGSNTVIPTANDSYTVTGYSLNGCSDATLSIGVANVTVNALPVITVNGGTICAGSDFTLTPSGAATYSYTGGQAVVSPTTTESYSVTGTDANGCISAAPAVAEVTVSAVPSLTVAGTNSICVGVAAITETVSGADTYSWSTGAVIDNISDTPTLTTTYSVTGTYTLTGCSSMATKMVNVDAFPTVTAVSGSVCAGDVFTITASGASSYSYSNGSNTVIPTANDNYTVTGYSANGCSDATLSAVVASVTVNALPTLTVSGGAICAGDVFTITPTGASTYTFSNGSNTVSPAANTSYSVTGTDANGCISAAAAVADVTVNALPTLTVSGGAICAGDVFTITPSGAVTYTYSNGSNTVSPTANTSYSVTGTDANGCISVNAVADVTVNALPTLTVNSGAICAGDVFTITASGASTYTYSNGSNTVIPTANDSYSVTGTDANGCMTSAAAVANVTVNALPVVTVNNGTICAGASFTITPAGASTYVYEGGSNVVNPTANQTYTVTGTDANGCTSAATATSSVTVNALPVITVNSGTICTGSSFTITPAGASTYVYEGGSNVVTPTANQTYTVSGTDANGCTSAAAATSSVTVNALPVVTVNSGSICAGNVFTMNPTGAATYTFANGSNTVSPSATASYSVMGSDANGCVSANAVSTVTVNALPNVTASVLTPTICASETTSITSSGAASYSWNSGESTATIVVTLTTTTSYTVTGTDANGCSAKATVTQNVSTCDGIAEHSNNVEAGLYPNPNNGSFTVKVAQPTSVKIINLVGQTVYASELNEGDNAVSLNEQPTGIYFVQLKQGNQVKTIRVVKNN